MVEKKWVYLFNELNQAEAYLGGDWDKVRGLLGGKGANLAEMYRINLPVPPFFTVTTEACNAYVAAGNKFPAGCWEQELAAMKEIETASGKTFGDPNNPLLKFENVIATPHMAGVTRETSRRRAQAVVDNLERIAQDIEPMYRVLGVDL